MVRRAEPLHSRTFVGFEGTGVEPRLGVHIGHGQNGWLRGHARTSPEWDGEGVRRWGRARVNRSRVGGRKVARAGQAGRGQPTAEMPVS